MPLPRPVRTFAWFLRRHALWWLVPLLLILAAIAALALFGESGGDMPFVYE